MRLLFVFLLLLAVGVPSSAAQSFVFGSDLSYANQMEDCGADFRENGQPKDVYRIFADHGTNLVRARLWVDPTWQNPLGQPAGVKSQYSDLEDVTETFERARGAGMQLMLGLQYSDFWADPGTQVVPARWSGVADNVQALKDSVYAYTFRVLTTLDAKGLMPEIVKIGNESNAGILLHRTLTANYEASGVISYDWSRQSVLFKSAIKAVRDAGARSGVQPKIALHFAGLNGLQSRYQNIINQGVTDFDIMGFSYYYSWHHAGIAQLGNVIRSLRTAFPAYEAMVVETGYPWTTDSAGDVGNIITTADPNYEPVSLVKQREYMVDYTREVMRAGGSGVIFWEPAWVSTPCRTAWGVGSSHEHVAFFSIADHQFLPTGAGSWPTPSYYEHPDHVRVGLTVDMTGVSAVGGVRVEGSLVGNPVTMEPLGSNRYYAFFYLPPGTSGTYRFATGSGAEVVPDACGTGGFRQMTVPSTDSRAATSWQQCGLAGPVDVTFLVDMTGQDVSRGVFITGIVTNWQIRRMTPEGDGIYSFRTKLEIGATGAYYFMTTSNWTNYLDFREHVPTQCATWYGSDRGYVVTASQTVFGAKWGTCEAVSITTAVETQEFPGATALYPPYPNPTSGDVSVLFDLAESQPVRLQVFDVLGRRVATLVDGTVEAGSGHVAVLAGRNLPVGTYWVTLTASGRNQTRMVVVTR